ncbi:MAG: trypsin-like peptidase domain-containing protein [Oscillospiraceae bacterium]|nr:trypsin-like peptidase domain-containing protein [Oscillospiraceae bacterium]
MDERRNNQYDPWEYGVYETGRTRPPKSRGGLVAVLLVIVIFLGGLVSALSVLNIRLFAQLNSLPVEDAPVSFVSEEEEQEQIAEPEICATIAETEDISAQSEDIFFHLNPSPDSVENVPQEGGLSLQEIYEKNIPSVVSISCTLPGGTSTGTGVIMSDQGYIVTNCHVVEDAHSITVLLTDERTFQASIVGSDAVSDLAVLYIEANDLIPAEFGDSGVLRVGDSVCAIGDPLGTELRGSFTNGIVSAINRDVTTGGRTLTLIQTNAAMNTGNSGGPLINCYGQVIGVNTMKISTFTDEAGVEGIGFAIPSATVQEIVSQLISQGYVSGRPTLGLSGEMVSAFYQHYYRLPAGLYITEVEKDSPASLVGIEPGDILVSLDNIRISSVEDMNAILYNHQVDDIVSAVIYRSGRQYSINLTLAESRGS